MPVHSLQTEFLEANNLRFETLTCGTGESLALLLHGFPETADSWRAQMPVLADMGYRVWAPNQRGYGNTTPRPAAMQAYAVEHLMDDVAALIDTARNLHNIEQVVLIAHDWGALVAWNFAARRLRALDRLVILNVPHPALFARGLRRNPRQILRSWYAGFFQLPRLPEWLLSRNHAALVESMMLGSSTDPEHFPKDLLAACRRNAAEPGATKAMIDWYRAYLRGGGLRRQLKLGFPVIDIPVLLLWGEADLYLGRETTDGTEQFASSLTMHFLPGVSHWVQQDATEACNESLRNFLIASEK